MPLSQSDLDQFYGTEVYHSWSPLFPKMVLSEGARYVAENGGSHVAYWLMDAIASHQVELAHGPDKRLLDMQFWTLKVNPDETAVLTCVADSGEPEAIRQEIEFTDFDLPEIRLWVAPCGGGRKVIFLPSEY
jgi:hypothetical protein